MDARGKLIEHNLRLVAYIVNKNYPEAVRGCQQDADDLISIGTIGLIRAAETFDYTKGRRFSTYASRCIDNAITHQRKHIREFQERHISVVSNSMAGTKPSHGAAFLGSAPFLKFRKDSYSLRSHHAAEFFLSHSCRSAGEKYCQPAVRLRKICAFSPSHSIRSIIFRMKSRLSTTESSAKRSRNSPRDLTSISTCSERLSSCSLM